MTATSPNAPNDKADVVSDIERIARSLEDTVPMNRECFEKGHVPLPESASFHYLRGAYDAYEQCPRCGARYARPMTQEETEEFRRMINQQITL